MMPRKASPWDYAFAIGKIRSQERFLIREEVFSEAIAASLEEALRLFVEAGLYNDELLEIKNSQQLEAVLNQEALELKNLIQNLLLDKELLCLTEPRQIKEIQARLKIYANEFLNDYISHLIDLHNIKSFLRLYVLAEPQEKLEAVLTCEGFIKKEFFLKLYGQDLAVFLNRLQYVHKGCQIIDYAANLEEAIRKLEKENSFVALEQAINTFLIQALRPAKYSSCGPEPVLAYYLAKANEINLIRMIILAKLNNLSADLMKERLNSVYA